MDTKIALETASTHLLGLSGHVFDVLDVKKPVSSEAAVNLAKVVSKLSPMLGNLIEFNTVEILNEKAEFKGHGEWKRQDPGFPDAIFQGKVNPTPGFEIKAWFPLATEVTARFKDSQRRFAQKNTNVAIIAWLPEKLIYGKPRIIGICVAPGLSVALARDTHYHNPPYYIVQEPEDTAARTQNLQQTNTSGHIWQGTSNELAEAKKLVASWGAEGKSYKATAEYQEKLRQLTSKYKYRNDTNYSKIDRIVHADIEKFKAQILNTTVEGMTVKEWAKIFAKPNKSKRMTDADFINKLHKRDAELKEALEKHLKITEADAETLIE